MLKKFLKFFNKPKYKLAGSCKKCGECCRNITFNFDNEYIKTEEQFKALKKWQKRYEHFYISGIRDDGALLFACKSIGDDNLCKHYWIRSWYCRNYPKMIKDCLDIGKASKDGCGYYLIPSSEFKDLL